MHSIYFLFNIISDESMKLLQSERQENSITNTSESVKGQELKRKGTNSTENSKSVPVKKSNIARKASRKTPTKTQKLKEMTEINEKLKAEILMHKTECIKLQQREHLYLECAKNAIQLLFDQKRI